MLDFGVTIRFDYASACDIFGLILYYAKCWGLESRPPDFPPSQGIRRFKELNSLHWLVSSYAPMQLFIKRRGWSSLGPRCWVLIPRLEFDYVIINSIKCCWTRTESYIMLAF